VSTLIMQVQTFHKGGEVGGWCGGWAFVPQ
jgi:hypothetical protein